MLRFLKDRYRRRQLARRGIAAELAAPTYTAGARSGAWTVCPAYLNAASVVYSFGVGDNLAWDLAMIARFGLTVHAFDPTPASSAWVGRQSLPPRLHFHPIGLAGHDGVRRLALPARGSRFNFRSPDHLRASAAATVEAPVARLATLMRRLGHHSIDVLKLDIEGGEYEALDDALASGIPIRQLLVEFHHHFPGIGLERTERAAEALRRAGFRIFHVSERGLELSLLRIADCHPPGAWLANPQAAIRNPKAAGRRQC